MSGEERGRGRHYVKFVDGPAHGTTGIGPGIPCLSWSACRKTRGVDGPGAWAHYIGADDDTARYAGPCLEFDHGIRNPWEPEPCCCGREGCDGRGPWPEPE